MLRYIASTIIFVLLSFASASALEIAYYDQFQEEEKLLLLEEQFVITATKTKKKVRRAPAIITVITAKEIQNMGARNLTDVLKTVPGLGIQISRGFARAEIEVRGVGTNNSEKVLVLIDGHKINNPFFGGATTITTNMPVDNIKKIEIVRGPGSALYGGNAFMAVINIITKKAEDVDGFQVTAARGSFDTSRFNLLFGSQPTDKLKVSGSVDYFRTDGAHLDVDIDSTSLPPVNQPNISMAPAKTDRWVKRGGMDLSISYADIFFKGNYIEIEHGAFVGVRNALSDETEMEFRQFFGELGFDHAFSNKSSLLAKIYYDQFDFDMLFELFPEGYVGTDPGSGLFPDGLLTRIEARNRTFGVNLQWDYELFKNNQLMLGFVQEDIKQYDVRTQANFDTLTDGGWIDPAPVLRDVTATRNFNRPADRRLLAFYVQDDWEINEYVNFILGVRYDDYSDFGNAISPRAGLTLHPTQDIDIKFLYGRAFRAPNFEELYNQNNRAVGGNPNLDAEILDTHEVGLGYRVNEIYQLGINYFHTRIKNHIIQQPTGGIPFNQFSNTGEVQINGVEAEFKVRYSPDNYGYINFSYQNAKDKTTGNNLPNVPKKRGNIGINAGLTKYLNANTHLFFSGKRRRLQGDGRAAAPAYILVDFTLIAKRFWNTMEIKGSIYNLFDKNYVDPAVLTSLPNDEPQPGRSYMLEVSYKF